MGKKKRSLVWNIFSNCRGGLIEGSLRGTRSLQSADASQVPKIVRRRDINKKKKGTDIYIYKDKGDFSVCAGRQIGAGYACASNHEHCCHAMMDAVGQVALQPRLLNPNSRIPESSHSPILLHLASRRRVAQNETEKQSGNFVSTCRQTIR